MTMRDVELVEPEDVPAHASATAPSFLDHVRRRPRWLAAGAAVVVGLVGYQVVSDQRARAADDARVAALADVPYVLDPVDPAFPVFQRGSYSWEVAAVPPVASVYLGMGVPVAGVLVAGSAGSGSDPDVAVVALDPSTAEVVWETTFPPPVTGSSGAGAWCSPPEQPDASTVPCVLRWALPPTDPTESQGVWLDVAVLVEVDATDGSVRHRTDVPPGATFGVGPWGLVVGTRDGSRLTLDATEQDGALRWTRTLDVGEADDETYLSLSVVEDRVLLTVGPEYSGWVLSADDGATLATLDGTSDGWGQASLLASGAVVVTDPARPSDRPTGEPAAMLVRPDGTEVPLDGDHVEWVVLDDGTLGDALLTGTAAVPGMTRTREGTALPDDEADGSVARLREPDGSVRWEVPGLDVRSAMAVDGLVVARTSDEVAAVDARTGRVRWRVDVPSEGSSMYQLLTDGRVILASRGTQLDALSYRGDLVWSAHVEAAGDGHVVLPGPAPTPAATPTGADAPTGDEVSWVPSLSGRLALGVMDSAGGQEYLVFGHG